MKLPAAQILNLKGISFSERLACSAQLRGSAIGCGVLQVQGTAAIRNLSRVRGEIWGRASRLKLMCEGKSMCWLAMKNLCPSQTDMHGFSKQLRNQVLGLFVEIKTHLKKKIKKEWRLHGIWFIQ